MLQQPEVGASSRVGYHNLTVQDRRLDIDLGELVGDLEIGPGIVTTLSAEELYAPIGQVSHSTYAVPFHLERPPRLIAEAGGVDQGREHGLYLFGEFHFLGRIAPFDRLRGHGLVFWIGLHEMHQPVLLGLRISAASVAQRTLTDPAQPAVRLAKEGDDDLFALTPLV